MRKKTQPASFEQALLELESLVSQLESGGLPLEQSLASYKRGTELLQFCQKTLADVEQQVRVLNEAGALQAFTQNDDE
ncbi:MAG: exodeoxyribonuclease VII small subunit [Methylobacillus sp.]|jgi:exodeoxyribonuclease VII small subunit|nr:exodeoxyribonuclease VII small subunit [Methylobacillus sp.]